jgi:hypothetical protein
VFRYFQLKAGRVELGRTLPADFHAGATPAENGVVVLPREAFGGAERISLTLTDGGEVAGAVFDYGSGVDFETRVKDYSAMGEPVRERSADGSEAVRWEDAATSFTLRRVPNGNGWTITAELRDRASEPR